MGVAKVIELIGESNTGWEDAVKDAVFKASDTVDGIKAVEVLNFTAHVDDGKVVEYKANVKLVFGVR
jgi:dodecin